MKTKKDFETMSSLDLFLYNGTLKAKDKYYTDELEYWHNESIKWCEECCCKYSKIKFDKWENAINMWRKTLNEKVNNKEEWQLLQKVAKAKGVNLKVHTIKLRGE